VREGAAELSSHPEKQEPGQRQPKYSIVTYLVILFAVVIALVLLSYAVQRVWASSELDVFRREHLSRMDQLELRVEEQAETIEALEQQLSALNEAQVALRAQADSAAYMAERRNKQQTEAIEALQQQLESIQTELDTLLEEIGTKE